MLDFRDYFINCLHSREALLLPILKIKGHCVIIPKYLWAMLQWIGRQTWLPHGKRKYKLLKYILSGRMNGADCLISQQCQASISLHLSIFLLMVLEEFTNLCSIFNSCAWKLWNTVIIKLSVLPINLYICKSRCKMHEVQYR